MAFVRGPETTEQFRMEIVVPSWKQHLLQLERMTKNEKVFFLRFYNLRTDQTHRKNGFHFLWRKKFSTGGLEQEDCYQITSINKPEERPPPAAVRPNQSLARPTAPRRNHDRSFGFHLPSLFACDVSAISQNRPL